MRLSIKGLYETFLKYLLSLQQRPYGETFKYFSSLKPLGKVIISPLRKKGKEISFEFFSPDSGYYYGSSSLNIDFLPFPPCISFFFFFSFFLLLFPFFLFLLLLLLLLLFPFFSSLVSLFSFLSLFS